MNEKELVGFARTNNYYYLRDAQGNIMSTYSLMGTETGNSVERTLAIDESSIYGSSRLGTIKREQWIAKNTYDLTTGTPVPVSYTTFIPDEHIKDLFRGDKNYELSNHLGNVLAVVSDRRTPEFIGGILSNYNAYVNSAQDYYSFGMTHPGRSFGSTTYKYGFNGEIKDDEWTGNVGATYDYGFRIYDSRIGRFLSVDPISKDFPWNSTYAFAENEVIRSIDMEGLEKVALSGSVPPEQYLKKDKNGDNPPPRTAYNSQHIRQYYYQALRLKKFGFIAQKVSTGQEILDALAKETASKGYVSRLAMFGHSGVLATADMKTKVGGFFFNV